MSEEITADGDFTGKGPFQFLTSISRTLSRDLQSGNLPPVSTTVEPQATSLSGTRRRSSLYDYQNGLCLIFNQKTYDMGRHPRRNGTDVDRDALKSYFEGIGFRVPTPFEDFTVAEIFSVLDSYANNGDHFDCLVC
ncbi:caspase-8-like protein, partial [Leptotrombidium deliense]